ncbi:MAG: signal transduction histidine kinase [Planctomycetota bacterium]|jgi:signal transduction histidine kinase
MGINNDERPKMEARPRPISATLSRTGSSPLGTDPTGPALTWDTAGTLSPPNTHTDPSTSADAPGESPAIAGAELWLSSPIRLAILAGAVVLLATLATAIGEIELLSAGGIDQRDIHVLVRQVVIWTLWALAAPALLWAAVGLGRRLPHWSLILGAHLALALFMGSLFLCAEIEIIEASQSEAKTQDFARVIQWMASREEGGRRGEGPDSQLRGGMEQNRLAREAEFRAQDPPAPPTSPGGTAAENETDREPSRRRGGRRGEPRSSGGGPRAEGGPPRSRGGWSRTAGWSVSTGSLTADFRRRWPLRVPRYALVYFAVIGIGLGIRSFLSGRSQERLNARLEADLARARLDALKGQLHPHFLFNSLHSVGGLIRTSRPDDALTALASIGDLLRTSLDAKPEQFVPLESEVGLIQRYLDVESLRLGDRLKITIDVPPELMPAEVPTFIAQPLVENAIKHAVAARASGGSITVRARQEGGVRLLLDVLDDGPGYDPKTATPGVGIAHVTERLQALFGDGASLDVQALPEGGTRARLTLPLDDLETLDTP